MHNPSFQAEGMASSLQQDWITAQDLLKSRLILEDDFTWTISSQGLTSDESSKTEKLRYIGGVDVSFLKEDSSLACGALVIVDAATLNVVHEEFDVTKLDIPYIPGFLAFREAPIILGLLNKMKSDGHPFYPQLLMVDGNGLLHPRGQNRYLELCLSSRWSSGKNPSSSVVGFILDVNHRVQNGTCRLMCDTNPRISWSMQQHPFLPKTINPMLQNGSWCQRLHGGSEDALFYLVVDKTKARVPFLEPTKHLYSYEDMGYEYGDTVILKLKKNMDTGATRFWFSLSSWCPG